MQSVKCFFVYAILDTIPFVVNDGLDDGGKCLVLMPFLLQLHQLSLLWGLKLRGLSLCITLLFFVLCHMVVGALVGS